MVVVVELLLEVSVPVVFNVIVCSLWKVRSYGRPSVAKKSLKVNNHLLFMVSKIPSLNPRAKIISPSQPATLTASKQPSIERNSPPITRAMLLNKRDQNNVFFRSPRAFLDAKFVTARRTTHVGDYRVVI